VVLPRHHFEHFLQYTRRRAIVRIARIAIVAFLIAHFDTVAACGAAQAERSDARPPIFHIAYGRAAIAIYTIAVIA
jgi:hypothetical protein